MPYFWNASEQKREKRVNGACLGTATRGLEGPPDQTTHGDHSLTFDPSLITLGSQTAGGLSKGAGLRVRGERPAPRPYSSPDGRTVGGYCSVSTQQTGQKT